MNLVPSHNHWCVFCIWLFPAVASSYSLPNSTVQFIQDAFQLSVRCLYLVDLERREWFESFLLQPLPKVILGRNRSIDSLDDSSMAVLYLDVTSNERIRRSFEVYFNNKVPKRWNAKLLVLDDDDAMNHPGVLSVLTVYFNHLGIAFWCMTGERLGTTMKYSVSAAIGSIDVTAPLNVQVYSYRRFAHLLHRLPVTGQVLPAYPYTYYDDFSVLIGMDHFIFSLLDYARVHLKLVHVTDKRVSVGMLRQMASNNLMHRTVDLTLTRWSTDYTFYPSIVLPETMDICLVVPRKLHPNHFEILLHPFSNTLWIAIGCALGLGQIVLYLAKSSTGLGRWMRQTFGRPPLNTFLQITTEVVMFVLIESYLAQVTSHLLVHRFQRDPATLEEFFATDIPMRYTDQQHEVFSTVDAHLSDRFQERAVPETACEEFSEACAHLDTVEHATFVINNRLPFDPISGQKSSFILPETLNRLRAQYLFARGATPLRDYFELHLNWLRAFGFVDLSRRPYDYSMEARRKRYVITDELIQMKHMVPFWIFLGIGWSVSVAVFLGERCIGAIARLNRRP